MPSLWGKLEKVYPVKAWQAMHNSRTGPPGSGRWYKHAVIGGYAVALQTSLSENGDLVGGGRYRKQLRNPWTSSKRRRMCLTLSHICTMYRLVVLTVILPSLHIPRPPSAGLHEKASMKHFLEMNLITHTAMAAILRLTK